MDVAKGVALALLLVFQEGNIGLSLGVIRSMIPGVHSKNNNSRNLALYYEQVRDAVQ